MSARIVTLGLGLTAVAALAFAAPASAAVTGVTIESPSGSSAKYGTGCTYEITATVDSLNGFGVNFYDVTDTAATPITNVPDNGTHTYTIEWTPTTTGTHRIAAQQLDLVYTPDFEVGQGTNLGSSCIVLPDLSNGLFGS